MIFGPDYLIVVLAVVSILAASLACVAGLLVLWFYLLSYKP